MTIFDILMASLFTGEPVELDGWELSFKEMRLQTVAALPYGVLPADAREWRQYCLRERAKAVRVLHAQDGLIRLLEAHGVECVIIKGAAAAMAYPQPMLRSMGDVDLLRALGVLWIVGFYHLAGYVDGECGIAGRL